MPWKKRLCSYQRFEVFSVHINNNTKDAPPADIIGDIFLIEDGSYTEVNGAEIFARKKGDYDSFQPGIDTELLLTGPCISHGIDPSLIDIYICFALFDYPPPHEDEDEDEEIIYMSYSAVDMYKSGPAMDATQWMVVRHWLGHTVTDKIQSKTIFGEYGSVTMDYIVFSISTVEATVEIRVLLKEEEGDDHDVDVVVDGRITAHNTLYEKNEILLFRSHKGKHVKHGELIPLSRCGLVLPFESTLVVRGANLSIANRCYATFRVPNHPCTSKRIVSGKHCKLLIQVTWTNYMDTVSNYYSRQQQQG